MRRLIPFLVAGVVTLALSACEKSVYETTYTLQWPPYSSTLVTYAGSKGVFPMQIRGQPFAEPVDAQVVARNIPLPAWINPARGTTTWPPEVSSWVRTVFVFNPVNPKQSFDNLCRDLDGVATRPPDGKTEVVMAAFCSGPTAASFTLGTGPMGTSVDSEHFQKLMFQVTWDLYPLVDPGGLGRCAPGNC